MSKQKLISGIEKLVTPVISTLGPNGKNVIIKTPNGVKITKDGVSVASYIKSDDPIEQAGIEIIREAALKNALLVGDGTTTATLLASQFIKAKYDKSELDMLPSLLDEEIKLYKLDSDNKIKHVAYIASNGDEVISDLVDEAFKWTKNSGIITVEQGDTNHVEPIEGSIFDTGYLSPAFVNKKTRFEAADVQVVITMETINTNQKLLDSLSNLDFDKPILLLANDVTGEAFSSAVRNVSTGNIKLCVCKLPSYGIYKQLNYETLLALFAKSLKSNELYIKGSAKKVVVSQDSLQIIAPDTTDAVKDEYLSVLWEKIQSIVSDDYQKNRFMEHYAKLHGVAAIIYVKSNNDIELSEKKDRIDDAIHAVKAALEEGVVPGGGYVFYKLSEKVTNYKDALKSPAAIIYSGQIPTYWLDDLNFADIWDPAKTLRVALETAISVTNLLHWSDHVIDATK